MGAVNFVRPPWFDDVAKGASSLEDLMSKAQARELAKNQDDRSERILSLNERISGQKMQQSAETFPVELQQEKSSASILGSQAETAATGAKAAAFGLQERQNQAQVGGDFLGDLMSSPPEALPQVIEKWRPKLGSLSTQDQKLALDTIRQVHTRKVLGMALQDVSQQHERAVADGVFGAPKLGDKQGPEAPGAGVVPDQSGAAQDLGATLQSYGQMIQSGAADDPRAAATIANHLDRMKGVIAGLRQKRDTAMANAAANQHVLQTLQTQFQELSQNPNSPIAGLDPEHEGSRTAMMAIIAGLAGSPTATETERRQAITQFARLARGPKANAGEDALKARLAAAEQAPVEVQTNKGPVKVPKMLIGVDEAKATPQQQAQLVQFAQLLNKGRNKGTMDPASLQQDIADAKATLGWTSSAQQAPTNKPSAALTDGSQLKQQPALAPGEMGKGLFGGQQPQPKEGVVAPGLQTPGTGQAPNSKPIASLPKMQRTALLRQVAAIGKKGGSIQERDAVFAKMGVDPKSLSADDIAELKALIAAK